MAVTGSIGCFSSLVVGRISVGLDIVGGYVGYMCYQQVLLGVLVVLC
jgi:hypothetical protein